jgi:NDP-sugar pyrophosphorylase family protein
MKAMILAAGLGTRLKPLTDTMPKALVPVGGKPLLQHNIEKLKAAGFDELIININHFAEQIIDFVQANDYFGIHIEFSDERENLLDTGGGIKKAAWFFDDDRPFLIHNADILSNINLREFSKRYDENISDNNEKHSTPPRIADHPVATLVCSERKTSRYLLFDRDNRLRGWINEKTGETKSPFPDFNPNQYRKLAFAGIQILRPSIFRYMDDFPDRFSIIDLYLSICDKETVTCYFPDNLKLIDVGKIESLQEAERMLSQIL